MSNYEAAQKIHSSLTSYKVLNPKAHSFVYIMLNLHYVSDDFQNWHPQDDEPLVKSGRVHDARYSRTFSAGKRPLEYILELDINGIIIGGEWVGNSKLEHPDFIWIPIARKEYSDIPEIKESNVLKIYQKSL